MANLTVRNLDDGIVEALKSLAKSENRSMEAEVRQILTEHIHRHPRHLPPHLRPAERLSFLEAALGATPEQR